MLNFSKKNLENLLNILNLTKLKFLITMKYGMQLKILIQKYLIKFSM